MRAVKRLTQFGRKPIHSELDFKDFSGVNVPLTPNAAPMGKGGFIREPSHLNRNKSERRRLQGLMRPDSVISVEAKVLPVEESSWKRFKAWMVNDGQRRLFFFVWCLSHLLVFAFAFLNFQLKDNLTQARATYGITYPIARAAALVLHLDVAFILLPICRNFISVLRRTPLQSVIPFDSSITFHKTVAWSMVFFTVVHIIAHMINFTRLAISSNTGVVGFIGANFLTGPGTTGWIMTLSLAIMVWYAIEKRRRNHFERFWYSHHLFIVFFINWQLHGMFCMIKPDTPPFCSFMQIGVFWKYWLLGGAIYTYERVLREVRARHRTYISKVIQHPSKVVEIQIKKEKTLTRAGQYIFLNCPEISFWQWHPFTLTSAPEEDYISVHIRVVGDFTQAIAEALGCDLSSKAEVPEEKVKEQALKNVLPRIMIDGPFGSASEDFYKFEVVVLVGAGIGVTPFASILKSIWYRRNLAKKQKPTRLQKVYFVWICRDFQSFEWFQSLLLAIEEQDLENFIEIHTYLTTKIALDDIENIAANDVGNDRDAVTRLRAPTHYGRPNWDRIFTSIRDKHTSTDVGVFFCGPKVLGHSLHMNCNKYTSGEADSTRFVYGKENF